MPFYLLSQYLFRLLTTHHRPARCYATPPFAISLEDVAYIFPGHDLQLPHNTFSTGDIIDEYGHATAHVLTMMMPIMMICRRYKVIMMKKAPLTMYII